MPVATLENRMARKSKSPTASSEAVKRDDATVKFDRMLADKLKTIIQRRGGTMSGYLSDLCRTHIDKEYAKVIREMASEVED